MQTKFKFKHSQFAPNLVSIIIPTYNRENFILNSIKSILNQSYRPLEIIIVDDGSTDNTRHIINEFLSKFKYDNVELKIYYQQNSGACVARNNGLYHSKGQFIQFLDSDDYLSNDKISDGVKILSQFLDVDFVYSLRADFDSNTKVITPWKTKLADLEKNLSVSEVAIKSVTTPMAIFRRSIIELTGKWNEELAAFQDWEYIGRVAYHSKKAIKINKIQSYCRQHSSGQISKSPFGDQKGLRSIVSASISLLNFVEKSQDIDKEIAKIELGRRCISAIRVAVATGQNELALQLINRIRTSTSIPQKYYLQILCWNFFCYIPSKINFLIFSNILTAKNKIHYFSQKTGLTSKFTPEKN